MSVQKVRLILIAFLLCLPIVSTAEVSQEEQDYFYNQMEALVDGIGNRNMAVEGQKKAFDYLVREYQNLGCRDEDGTLQLCDIRDGASLGFTFGATSIIGIRKARTDKPNIIALCAHYDSIFLGARDNASGVAGVLMLLRRLGQMEPYENCELHLIAFTAEETGHQGSAAYVQGLSEEERNRIIAVFNLDILVVDVWEENDSLSCDTLGGRVPGGYAGGTDMAPASNAASRAFVQAIHDLRAFEPQYEGIEYAVRTMGESDHDSFHFAGIDAANISFRGNIHTDGSWTALMHTENDVIGDFDWDRTWQALDIVYTATDGLARDASYGQGIK